MAAKQGAITPMGDRVALDIGHIDGHTHRAALAHSLLQPLIEATMQIVDFEVEVSHIPGSVVLTVLGELDMVSRPILQSALDAHAPHEHVVIDFLGVPFIDSSGLELIATQALHRNQAGGSLRLRNCMFPVRQLIDLTGLIHLFEFDDGTGMPDMGADAEAICARPLP